MRSARTGRPIALAALTAALAALAAPASATTGDLATAHARLETPPNFDDKAGGSANADDPAIWNHPSDRRGDLVIGTLKKAGLAVYDTAGNEIQRLAAPAAPTAGDSAGRFNNVDVVYGWKLGGRKVDVAVVSDRGRDTIRTYVIDPAAAKEHRAPLTDVTLPSAPPVFSSSAAEVNEQRTAYGLAAWKGGDGVPYVAVSRRNTTRVGLFRLVATAAGKVGYAPVRNVDLPASFALPNGGTWAPCEEPGEDPQVEGMVGDPEHGVLYAAQEDVGVWRIPLGGGKPALVDRVKEYGVPATYDPLTEECHVTGADPGYGGTHLTADAEGLTIYAKDDGEGYLLASSQGDNTFVAYDREDDNDYLGRFRIAPGTSADGSEECDGAMVTSAPVGDFKHGLLVVQDGFNAPDETGSDGEVRTNTNFKFVDWREVAEPLDLDVAPGDWDPRD
ncbi:phytase [Spirillospora sp. NPDC049652]